jgi:MFS family permease
MSPESTLGSRFIGMNLAPGVRGFNMGTFYWACLTGILLSTFVPQMQPYLLSEHLGIAESEQGVISGNLSFWGEVAIILMVGFWGTLSDRIGRRPVMALGYLIMTGGILLYPRAENYAELVLARLAFATGVAAYSVMIVTLVADYVSDDSRGKAAGMLGFFNGVGALITVMVLLRLPAIFQGQGQSPVEAGTSTYQIIAVMTLLTAILMWFGLSRRESRKLAHGGNILKLGWEGLLAGREPGIALAYAASFVARGNLAIVGTFFTLWLANYGTIELGMSRADALAKAGGIIAITQSMALVSAPFFGILTDRIDRISALNLTLLLAFLGYGGTVLVENPFGIGMIACGILIGMSEVGCIITSSVLIAQQTPERIRGSVIGFFNLTGALGIMVASKLGGTLFDSWREAAPFMLFGGFALLVLIWSLLVRRKIRPLAGVADPI